MARPALTVAILAGGAALRLGGRDKGLEILGDRPLIEWVIAYCRRSIVGVPGSDAGREVDLLIVANRHLEAFARYARVRTDAEAGFRGPLAGVASALETAAAERVLTLPVDCPFPPADLAARLEAAMHAGGAAAVVAHDGQRRQPLFALYRRELAASAAEAAAAGQGVHAWQDAIGAAEVDFSDRHRQFHNLNTPEDFAACADALRSCE
jgi:molybdopterin-guanine dinucleotide biosynthesis protein A